MRRRREPVGVEQRGAGSWLQRRHRVESGREAAGTYSHPGGLRQPDVRRTQAQQTFHGRQPVDLRTLRRDTGGGHFVTCDVPRRAPHVARRTLDVARRTLDVARSTCHVCMLVRAEYAANAASAETMAKASAAGGKYQADVSKVQGVADTAKLAKKQAAVARRPIRTDSTTMMPTTAKATARLIHIVPG